MKEESMYKKASIALLVFSLLLAACAKAASPQRSTVSEGVTVQNVEAPAQAPAPALQAYDSGSKSAYAIDQTSTSVDRLVIKNASLSMAVNDPLKSMDNISHMAENMGGFVVNADMYQQTLSNGVKVPQVSMTIRVPAEKLDEALATIKQETDQPIISENESSQDVTAEYTDLNSRLTNLQAAENQLQVIMDSATKTEDVLSVYSQLVSVREQIELIKGQMKYYEQSAALSSISIQLMANAAVQPIIIAGWQPGGVAKEALQSLIHTLQSLASFGIRLALLYLPTLLVIFIPIGLIVWGIIALVRKSRKPKTSITPAPGA
jgi:outer membrane biogenesis lipoprotein LolB